MPRPLTGYIFSVALVATLSIGAIGTASAAPVTTAAKALQATALPSPTQSVRWIWRHHHRVWVGGRHH
jgi:hypothetical protein